MDNKMVKKSLPDEVVVEILSWLPTKSLLRFRCVSKTWFKLLTNDTHFSNLHLDRSIGSNRNTSILALTWNIYPDENVGFYVATNFTTCDQPIHFELPFHQIGSGYADYIVYGICNGLILLGLRGDKEKVYLWNPYSRVEKEGDDYIVIQVSPAPTATPLCDSQMFITFSFGFCRGTNQYKILRFVETHGDISDLKVCVSVYTLGTDSSWRSLEENFQYNALLIESPVALVNESLHWILYNIRDKMLEKQVLVSFDLKHEVFKEIIYPSDACIQIQNGCGCVRVVELDGLLCLFCLEIEADVQIWAMREYGAVDSWSKHFKFGQSEIFGSLSSLKLLGVVHSGEVIVKRGNDGLMLYNPKTNSIWKLKKFPFPCYAYMYIRSRVSPRTISGARHHHIMETKEK